MTDSLRGLLDNAVPPIPDQLRHAPVAELVRRGRRQRRRARLAAAAAGLVAVAATALVVQIASGGPAPSPAPPATRTSEETGVPWRWVAARLDRTERQLTIYLATVAGCRFVHLVDARASESQTEAIVNVQALSLPSSDCSNTPYPSITATLDLSAPLGNRVLRDAYDHRRPRLYRERELPLLAEHGWELPDSLTMAADGNSWSSNYTRRGGPDISIEVGPTARFRQPASPAAGTAAVGDHTGVIYPHPAMQSYEIRWPVDDLTYSLTAFPTEGETITLDQFRSLIRALEWD